MARLALTIPYGLIGRGSHVRKAQFVGTDCVVVPGIGRSETVVVAKTSWPSSTRTTAEVAITFACSRPLTLGATNQVGKEKLRIRGKLEDALPKCYMEMDLNSLKTEGFRARVALGFDVEARQEEGGDEHWAKVKETLFTRFDSRIPRLTVFETLASVLLVIDEAEYRKCFQDIFQG